MKKLLWIVLSFAAMAAFSGCVSATASKISAIKIGMSRQEVEAVMGKPDSVSAHGPDLEYLNYTLTETKHDAVWALTTPYFVRLMKGHVDAFGRKGDFDNTNTPTVRVESDSSVKTDTTNQSGDLYAELTKLDELRKNKLITEDEFQAERKRIMARQR